LFHGLIDGVRVRNAPAESIASHETESTGDRAGIKAGGGDLSDAERSPGPDDQLILIVPANPEPNQVSAGLNRQNAVVNSDSR
jgi:hypothetical protein